MEHKIGLVEKKLITKYAGHDDQLSFKHWGMDRFRVLTLEKLFIMDSKYRNLIITILLQKYKLLLKGAIKYDKISEITSYQEKINFYTRAMD
jgi:hypothetical protein